MSEEVQSKVQRIVDTETTVAAQESGVTLTVQPGVVEGLITRSLVSYATTILATDVEAFANHAGRDTVTAADVQLAVRRLNGGREHLDSFLQQRQSQQSTE